MAKIRFVLAIVVLAFAGLPLLAATTAERSPFFQGHWWTPQQPGSGFDVFDAAGQTMVVWFTYDAAGRPVWYTAQGTTASAGQAWPLLRHRWTDGRKGAAQQVGTLSFTPSSMETAQLGFEVNGVRGSVEIQPFIASTARREVDRTGHWFAPAQQGWGLSLTEQGDVIGGVLFAYNAAGEPTWFAGFGREGDSVQLHAFTGTCPGCTYATPTSHPAGRLTFGFRAEDRITLGNSLTATLAPGIALEGAAMVQLSRPASTRAADTQLASFHSWQAVKAFFEAGLPNIIPVTWPGADFSPPAPPPPTPQHSTTTLQEAGVDEADTIKTDGRFLYAFDYTSSGLRLPTIRVAEVANAGESVTVRGSVHLARDADIAPASFGGLYLDAARLTAVTGTQPMTTGNPAWLPTTAWLNGRTRVEIFDVSQPASPASVWRMEISGHPVASRRIGDRLYVVSRFIPSPGNAYQFGAVSEASRAANRALVAATRVEDMLPQLRINGGAAWHAIALEGLLSPPPGSNRPFADLIVVATIDLASRQVVDTWGIAGSVETVYVSPASIYLASSRVDLRNAAGQLAPARTTNQFTDIHQLRLAGGIPTYAGSATVEGFLGRDLDKTAFRLSEHEGRLRAVTSRSVAMDWGLADNVNRLTILEPAPGGNGLLRTVSVLPNASRPQRLGLPWEELYATRFLGDKLYAVTFTAARAVNVPFVDPLYVVDLSQPTDPRIRGELVVPGFSDYLHPLGNGLLLGVGRQMTLQGIAQGLQLSLFDVRDDANPRVIEQVTVGKRGTESALLRHHHAISFFRNADGSTSFAFPARLHDGAIVSGTGDAANYAWQESGLLRYRVDAAGAAAARFVAEPKLVTHRPPASLPADPAANGARSVIFANGVIYVANGRIWRQSLAGIDFGPL
jgi:uncharacterized secreted protein with C-terminal beta-propeller domain